jgi:glucose-1-phosphate thymidylyltransferase
MNCVILAAGYATRLYPLTEHFPKPLLRVGEKTILDWLMDDLSSVGGIGEFVLVSNHRFAGQFQTWADGRAERIRVLDDGSTENENRLGAVRDLRLAAEYLGGGDELLVIAGDNLLDFSLGRLLAYAREKGSCAVMRYAEPSRERLKKCGVLTVDAEDRITGMAEKSPEPPSRWVCPPFYVYTREAASLLPRALEEGCGADAPGSFLAWLCERLPVYAMEMPGKRYDIGTLESYEQVKKEYHGIKGRQLRNKDRESGPLQRRRDSRVEGEEK